MSEPERTRSGYRESTLRALPPIEAGDSVECTECGESHVVSGFRNLFIICRGRTMLAGVAGRCVLGVAPDAPDQP